MSTWEHLRFEDTIVENNAGRAFQINSSDYKLRGVYPVVDQSQAFIAGYCDDAKKVYREQLPVVVFGDHTRILKYIDFPFVIGADGVKVISPDTSKFDPLYYYYALLFLKIPNRGYNRHFGLLREFFIPKPSSIEQLNIARILSTLQRAIQKQEEIISTTQALKKSLLNKLFTEGTKGEPLRQTEIGVMPVSWRLEKLSQRCDVKSGGTPSREVSEYWTCGTIPWVKTGEITYSTITDTSEKITLLGLKNSSAKKFPAGTLLMAMYGQGVTRGRVGLLGIEAAINQACAAIIPFSEEEISSRYLYRYFEYHYESIRELGHGANQKNLSATIIKNIFIGYPKFKDEQERIYSAIDSIDHKFNYHKKKKEAYENLFGTLLNELMTGSIRVDEMDFNAESTPVTKEVQHKTVK